MNISGKTGVGLVSLSQAALITRTYPPDGARFEQAVSDLTLGAEHFEQTVDRLERDGFYTPKGLPGQVKAEAEKWRAALVEWRKSHIDPLAAAEQALIARAGQRAPTPSEDVLVRYLRHQNIRDHVERIADSVARHLLVTSASARGDRDFLEAISEAPAAFPLVDGEVIAKARQTMAAAASPELIRIQVLKDAYASVLAMASQELKGVLTRFMVELEDTPTKTA